MSYPLTSLEVLIMAMVCTLLIEAYEYMDVLMASGMSLRRAARSAHKIYSVFPARALLRCYGERP